MLVTIGIHHPRGENEKSILRDGMRKFGEAQRKHEGLIVIHLLKDEKPGVLIGLAIWDTKEHFMQAQKDMAKALEGINFELLEDIPHKLYFAEPVP